ncbi:hypothetical protein AVEN_30196-1 [Araneus ventricosus]|uniref:Uncharacterized protein n=1 Tax=Araneus ventricosus TaxID=182803 RepID=A0A4Y2DPV8_ARAVE|nr:hypothetical protein AVEN_30196-1 [Araneus ventricosus]
MGNCSKNPRWWFGSSPAFYFKNDPGRTSVHPNKNILHDLDMSTIQNFFSKLAINFVNNIDNHSNPAIRSIPNYDPTLPKKNRAPRTLTAQQ